MAGRNWGVLVSPALVAVMAVCTAFFPRGLIFYLTSFIQQKCTTECILIRFIFGDANF